MPYDEISNTKGAVLTASWIVGWPVWLLAIAGSKACQPVKGAYDRRQKGKANKLLAESQLEHHCNAIQNDKTGKETLTISLDYQYKADSTSFVRCLLPLSQVVAKLSEAFSKNNTIITAEFVGRRRFTYADIYTILKDNTSVRNIRIDRFSRAQRTRLEELLQPSL